MPRLTISSGARPSMRSPLKRIAPATGARRTGTRPRIVLITVVLPAPLPPIRLTISPEFTDSVTPDSTCRGPYPASTDSTARSAPGSGTGCSEIRLDDGRIAHHVGGPPLGDLLAIVQHDDAISQVQDGL